MQMVVIITVESDKFVKVVAIEAILRDVVL